MKNRLLARALGENTGDVVPVLANVPRRNQRDRSRASQEQADDDRDSVKRMVGEADERSNIIPDDAEPVDASEMTYGKPIKAPKDVVQEPSHPTADKEKYLTPYSALTAPDVTPMSTQPIDPSEVPGASAGEKFTAADLEKAGETEPAPSQPDMAARAMDVLLGKNRAGNPAKDAEEFTQAGDITTEQAERMVGVTSLNEDAAGKAAAAMVAAQDGGAGMPEPTPHTDGSKIYSAFRRFAG